MKAKKPNQKSRAILKSIAEGHSFEQILAQNPSLNYHDIFRAVTEAPTSYWRRKPANGSTRELEHAGVATDACVAPQAVFQPEAD